MDTVAVEWTLRLRLRDLDPETTASPWLTGCAETDSPHSQPA